MNFRASLRRPAVRVVLAVGLAAAIAGGVWVRQKTQQARRALPALYLVSLDKGGRVRAGGWSRPVETALTIAAGRSVKLPAGSRWTVIHAVDGREERVEGPRELLAESPKPPAEPQALRSPLPELAALVPVSLGVNAGTIRITSPAGVTRFTDPVIDWVAREGVFYDVAVLDSGDRMAPPRVAERVRPPLALSTLETTLKKQLPRDRLHEVVVREAGSETVFGLARFLTAADAGAETPPIDPAALLLEAVAAVSRKPARTGDAWLALSRLPPAWADSELGLRLRLQVSAQLELTDEWTRVHAAVLRRIGK